jgi:hypothetical protein
VSIDGGCEAIIDRETFDAAQSKLAALKAAKRRPRANSPYLLTGLAHCGVTGLRVWGYAYHAKGQQYRYYRFAPGGRAQRGGIRSVRAEAIESFVLNLLRESVLADGDPEGLRNRIRQVARRQLNAGANQSPDLQQKLAAINAKIATATERLLTIDSDLLDDARRVLDGLRAERDRLRAELAVVGDVPAIGVDDVTEKAARMVKTLRKRLDSADPAVVRGVIQSFVSRIDLFWSEPKKKDGRQFAEFSHGIVEMCAMPAGVLLFPPSTGGSNSRTAGR